MNEDDEVRRYFSDSPMQDHPVRIVRRGDQNDWAIMYRGKLIATATNMFDADGNWFLGDGGEVLG